MKKKNIVLIIIGIALLSISAYLLFGNSKKKIDMATFEKNIASFKTELTNLEITDKLEQYKEYQIKVSELSISLEELNGIVYESYKEKEISLYDYYQYQNKIKKFKTEITSLRDVLVEKTKDAE